jgi:hypothetical protein
MFISLEPFILALDTDTIDLSILSMNSAKGMRSFFRLRVEKSFILLHILWHFNWFWGDKNKVQPQPQTDNSTCPICAREEGIHWPTCPNDPAGPRPMTEEQIMAAALSDPDAQPLTEEDLKRMKPHKPHHMIEIREQLTDAVKTDDEPGRMKSKRLRKK